MRQHTTIRQWQQVLLQGLAVCLLAAVPAHSSRHGSQQSSSATASRHTALPADAAWPSGRRLLVEEFKGAPSAEEKLADAEKLLSQRPDNLLRNLKVKAQTRTSMLPEGCEVSESGLKMRTKTLVEGETNILGSADACAAACKDLKACNAWFWCNDMGGCETEQQLPVPVHACQLQKQAIRYPVEPPVGWKASRFVAGYDGASGPSRPVPPEKQVALVAPVTTQRCPLAYGLTSLKQAFINKHDYARLHSYEFHSHPVARNRTAPGTWYRLQVVKQALADIPPARAGWVLFADQDVLCDEMGFKVPFTKYEGKDLVLWGSAKLVREDAYQRLLSVSHKDRQQGLDTGVMLFRNTEWSRTFVDDALAYLRDEAQQTALRTSMKTWEPLLYEQNAVAHLLQTPERLAHIDFETEYCINCAWAHGLQGKLPFLKRFSECSFCTGFRNSREQMYECNTELVKTFGFSNRMALGILGCGQGASKGESINPTDPGPRAGSATGGGDASSGSSSSSALVSQRLAMSTSQASGPNPIMAFASFMRTHFFTMAFVAVFFASFLSRTRRRRPPPQ